VRNNMRRQNIKDPEILHLPQAKLTTELERNSQKCVTAAEDVTSNIDIGVQNILDALPFYVLLVDSDHYIIEANAAVKTHLGLKREEILGKYCPLIIHGINEPFEGCPLEDAARENRAIERDILDKKSGRWVRSSIYPTRALTPEGKKVFLHMVIDITESKQAQDQLRISHMQLRELSAHLETVREEEKRKIARDLHDETSQLLASLHAYLEAAMATLPGDAIQSRELLKKAQTMSTTVLDEVHRLVYELRPSMLDELGLVAAINSMIENTLKVAGLKVKFKVTGEIRRLTPSVETSLYRIIQEGFNNIIKHAQANKVKLNLRFSKKFIRVVLKDDGVGFDMQGTTSLKDGNRGMGLISIRERVELMHGSLNIDSSPGQGTQITIAVPLISGE
jgi:PAS domain S-box-containing protein